MTALRELLAVFGLEYDDRGIRRAEAGVNGLLDNLGRLQSFLVGSALTAGFGKMILAASDAAETMNVVETSFEHNAGAVVEWANIQAGALGRSEFKLREYAGGFGAMLRPILGNADAAAKMSTELAALAVDLGSFFNVADDDVVRDLRSAFAGSTETMQKYGIIATDTYLQQFALTQGITKTVQKMSQQEKAQLRFNYILEMSRKAQGDAVKTGQGFANSLKALQSAIIDLGTRTGDVLLPAATRIVHVFRDGVRAFSDMAKHSYILEASLATLGLIAGALLVPFLPLILNVLVFAGAALFLTAVLEDLFGMLNGKDSLLGRIGDEFARMDQGAFLDFSNSVQFLLYLFNKLLDVLSAVAMAFTGDFSGLALLWEDFVEAIKTAGGMIFDALTSPFIRAWKWYLNFFVELDKKLLDLQHKAWDTAKGFVMGGVNAAAEFMGVSAGSSSSSALATETGGRTLQNTSSAPTVVQQNQTKVELNLTQTSGEDGETFLRKAEQRFREVLDQQYENALHSTVQGVR